MENTRNSKKNAPLLLLMATVTLLAILCELVPSGVLPQMSEAFGVSTAKAGGLVGSYAIASAIFGLPLVAFTVTFERRRLLVILLMGFAVANGLVAVAPSYEAAMAGRFLGGICAGTLWPMITAYGMALVDEGDQGRAVAIIMSGITVGMSLGLPFMTWIGTTFNYHVSFVVLAAAPVAIAAASRALLPKVEGEARSKGNSPLAMLQNRGVLLMITLTFLAVGANYGVYTYVTNLVADVHYPGVAVAQLFFGAGSVLAVILSMLFIDRHLYGMFVALYLSGAATMAAFCFGGSVILFHAAFVLWGLGFGAMSSMFQTATARQVTEGVAVANAVQSMAFNFAIMVGTTTGGLLLEKEGTKPILLAAMAVLLAGLALAAMNSKRFERQ
ncbi:MFS transporter [Peptoniphilus rachelemmaiella]|uniref:MFS transporter n=1 Tax=Peptoniphilus rachelemmaiella TaxID=2811779 RepID=UPI00203B25E0|nr:MFS transporter [Peptoniphilus rachelemmaiella]